MDRPALRHGGGLLLHGRHPGRPTAAAGRCLVELARPPGLALRRPRRDLAGDPQRRREVPRRTSTRPSRGSGSSCPAPRTGVVFAGTEPGAVFRSTDGGETFALERGAVGPPPPHRSGTPASAARPSTRSCRTRPTRDSVHRRHLHRRRLPDRRRRRESWEPRNQGIKAEFLPEGQQYPEFGQCVHKVARHPSASRAALPPEPRRRLPLRRRRRLVDVHRRRAARASSGSRSWCTRTSRTRSSSSRSAAPDGRYPADGKARVWRSARRRGDLGGAAATGLPDDFFVGVMRDAMCADAPRPRRASTSVAATVRSAPPPTTATPGARSSATCPT